MKKQLFIIGLAFVFTVSSFLWLDITTVKAQLFEYQESCDVLGVSLSDNTKNGILNEFDLKKIKDLIDAKTECSTETDVVCLCDSDSDNDCDSKDYRLCKSALGAVSTFTHTGISNYPDETYVLGLNINKENVKAHINENNYNLTNYPNINTVDSSWFENFYSDFKYTYSKRKYLNPASYAWADLNNDGEINKEDKKTVSLFRKYLKKAYGKKVIPEANVYSNIMAGVIDLNQDGAINSLDKKVASNLYKKLRLHLKGKADIIPGNFNFDPTDENINEADLGALKTFYRTISKYYHLYNYSSADIKAKILANDFDMNNDYVVNKTDFDVVKDYKKKLKRMTKYSSEDVEYNNDYNLNEEAEAAYDSLTAVDDSDILLFTKYYVAFKQHRRYGKVTYKTPDTIAPLIFLKGETNINLALGENYEERGFSAWDNRERTLTKMVEINNGGLDVNVAGTYTITYTVSDGVNTASVTRLVTISEGGGEENESTNYSLRISKVNDYIGGTLTISSNSYSTTNYTAGVSNYAANDVAILTATPDDGYVFHGWVGDCQSIDGNVCTVLLDGDKEVSTDFRQELNACVDNDDGISIFEKGITTGWDSYGGDINTINTYTDTCNGDRILEYHCAYQNDPHDGDGYISMSNEPCENGCEDGACISTTCDDSEEGISPFEKGIITGWDNYGGDINTINTYTDTCNGDRILEYHCAYQNDPHDGDGYISMSNEPCENGCEDGACIPGPTQNTYHSLRISRVNDYIGGSLTISSNSFSTSNYTAGVSNYYANDVAILIATPDDGYVFHGWAGDCQSIDGNVCIVLLDGDKEVSTDFRVEI